MTIDFPVQADLPAPPIVMSYLRLTVEIFFSHQPYSGKGSIVSTAIESASPNTETKVSNASLTHTDVMHEAATERETSSPEVTSPVEGAEPPPATAPAVASPPTDETEAPPAACPKCQSTTPWKQSSWCPDCGYYPGVTELCPESAAAEEIENAEEDEELQKPAPLIAPWIVQLIAINTTVVVLSIAARYYFVFYDGSFRGLSALALIVVGFATAFFMHLRASIDTMQKDARTSPFDIIGSPIEMWRSTIQCLPDTSARLVWGVAGVTMLFSGAFIIGGIDFNQFFEHDEVKEEKPDILQTVIDQAMQHAPPEEDQPETLEEALNEIGPITDRLEGLPTLPQPGQPMTCVIYGYMKDGNDDFGRVLLAAEVLGQRQHVATLQADDFPESARAILAEKLSKMVTETNTIPTKYHAIWVNPSVGLRVDFSGWSVLGEMLDPTISRPPKRPTPPATAEP